MIGQTQCSFEHFCVGLFIKSQLMNLSCSILFSFLLLARYVPNVAKEEYMRSV